MTHGIINYVITIFHESFIHVDLNAKVFSDNGKFDFSNIPKLVVDHNKLYLGRNTSHAHHTFIGIFKVRVQCGHRKHFEE